MQHIMKEVKAVTKKYTTKSGVKKSTSKRVDLGVTDMFNIGECVAVISKSDFDNISGTIAETDATIINLNDSVVNYKAEIESKNNIINDLSNEIKELKTKVAELESDISTKNVKLIESGNVIDGLNDKVDKLTATVSELEPLLSTKDSIINEFEKQISIYDAIDIDGLKEKSKKLDATMDELDKSKNLIIRFQNEKIELKQLVHFHKEKSTAYKNQRWFSKILGRDATADISTPTLVLFDLSGNDIVDDNDATANTTAIGDDSGKTSPPNDN